MLTVVRPVIALVALQALLIWGASEFVRSASRENFERDVALRSQLAIKGAREALATHLRSQNRNRVGKVLTDLTHDERLLAAALCGRSGISVHTAQYPPEFGCDALSRRSD